MPPSRKTRKLTVPTIQRLQQQLLLLAIADPGFVAAVATLVDHHAAQ